ncbi:MAG: bL9 family ribosomal protein [Acidobacteriota bacterium]|nr:bL9 family ribosomal protein [Acidobacteriota bacterium]
MKIILKETINSLGIIGSEATVADGYARNYLFPQNKAVPATSQNRRMLEQDKVKLPKNGKLPKRWLKNSKVYLAL